MTIRVAVVDDHPLYREGVIHVLGSEPDIEVVASGNSCADAVHIAARLHPDVILLDMNMPGDGINAVEEIAQFDTSIRTVLLTVVADEQKVCDAMQKGAHGYVLKGIAGKELVETVRSVNGGEPYVSPALATKPLASRTKESIRARVEPDKFSDLTGREDEILGFVARGYSNKEIGNSLGLSEKTVKHYVTNILQKLHVRNRVEAALLATKRRSGEDAARRSPAPTSTSARPVTPVQERDRA